MHLLEATQKEAIITATNDTIAILRQQKTTRFNGVWTEDFEKLAGQARKAMRYIFMQQYINAGTPIYTTIANGFTEEQHALSSEIKKVIEKHFEPFLEEQPKVVEGN